MPDERLRNLERKTATGDPRARVGLIENRARAGLCPWCGAAGAMHAFETKVGVAFDAACCCATCFGIYGPPTGLCSECPGVKKAPAQEESPNG